MKKTFILLYLVFTVATVWAEEMDRNSSKECAVCHYEWMPEFVYELKGTDILDYQGEKVVATEKMCFSCHNGTVADSRIRIWAGDMHKIQDKITEGMQIPDNLPLDDGKINCRTCHTAHASGDPKAEGIEKGVFLRLENADSQLCQACHSELDKGVHPSHPLKRPEKNFDSINQKLKVLGARLGSQGQIICQSCHTPHSPRDKALLIYPVDDSKLCSICHTDKVNPDNAAYVQGMLNHPIDIRHDNPDQVVQVKKAGGVYGKRDEVICLTCHAPHNGKTESLLIKNNAKNELCNICHDNKKSVVHGKHDMLLAEGFRTKDGKSAPEKGTCQSCHAPHGWSLELPATDRDMLSAGCRACHRENGFAGKKVLSAKGFNHPVGKPIKKSMKPGDLPLFSDQSKDLNGHLSGRKTGELITCATCHDVHSNGKNFLRTAADSGQLCISCHAEMEIIEKTVHGQKKLPKSCLSCHKVHNCENKRLLNLSKNDGCLECHRTGGGAEKLIVDPSHSHPVNMLIKKKLKEPFKITSEGRFTCVTCHDPHKPSKTDKMQKDFLRGAYAGPDAFCVACHETQKEITGSDHDIRKNGTDPLCGQCHSVHNAKTAIDIMTVEYPYKNEDDSCKACHNVNGSASNKINSGGHRLGKIDQVQKYRKQLAKHDGEVSLYCSSCHSVHNNGPPKGSEGTMRNSFLKRSLFVKGNFCIGCHEDKMAFTASRHNVNHFETRTEQSEVLKAEANTCGVCHKVHNSGYFLFEASLGQDFVRICTSCHNQKGLASNTSISTSHKLNINLKNDLAVRKQNGKLVCVTCHDPHAKNKAMLRSSDSPNLCVGCHGDRQPVEISKHNFSDAAYQKSEIGKNAQDNVCSGCHKPHNFKKDNRLMWALDPLSRDLSKERGSFAFGMCTGCHMKEGLGREKIPEVLTHEDIFKIFPMNVKEIFKQHLYDESGASSINGSITCQSCHDPHAWKKFMNAPGNSMQADAGTSFLRQNVRENFCAKCHGLAQSEELFLKFHDKKFRDTRNNKRGEVEVLRNLMQIQINLTKVPKN